MSVECEKLELFLSGELARDELMRFEAHLVACEACSDAIDQQRWIDGLLRSASRFEFEPAPFSISTNIRHTLTRRRKARLAACGFAAAAALVVAAGGILALNWQSTDVTESSKARAVIAEVEPSPSPSQRGTGISESPRAVFDGGADVFVASVESRHPNVTIVRVYQTYNPIVRPSVESDADPFNGG